MMKKNYIIFAITFLSLLMGQRSSAQVASGDYTIQEAINNWVYMNPDKVKEINNLADAITFFNTDGNPNNNFVDVTGDHLIDINDNLVNQNLSNAMGIPINTMSDEDLQNLWQTMTILNDVIVFNNYHKPVISVFDTTYSIYNLNFVFLPDGYTHTGDYLTINLPQYPNRGPNIFKNPCGRLKLSDLVYDSSNGIPNDYSKLPSNVTVVSQQTIPGVTFTRDEIGFNSILYKVDYGGGRYEYVYSTAGTSPFSGADWTNNLQQGVGVIAAQYDLSVENARAIYRWASQYGYDVSFTGHSLGGGLANANALATGYPATLYNPAGLHDDTITRLELNLSNESQVNYWVNTGEIVDMANTTFGTPARGYRNEFTTVPGQTIISGSLITWSLSGLAFSGYLHTIGSIQSGLNCD